MVVECDGMIFGVSNSVAHRETSSSQHRGEERQTKNQDQVRASSRNTPSNINVLAPSQLTSKIIRANSLHKKNPGRLIKDIRRCKKKNTTNGQTSHQLFETAIARIRGYRVIDNENVVMSAVKKHKSKIKRKAFARRNKTRKFEQKKNSKSR
ncbi:WecB/TagA/CpsF family glycosyl transferase [Perkinsela sp. CCAP 1560/4]|nr:hypothetical protein XU18_5217 [Perkinsela sp. CCAP 1560/4]KNH04796.1 WecB/TagA/CpsF family glycosyl transferase [Perkinsela sp. CCAP 1560/4]|eukprot:KNH00540.1 hypothetical protein XU18_5217 [Perkinsela sp. CCAP 1560/4]